MLRNSPLRSYALFLIVALKPFIDKPVSSRNLVMFMIALISSLEIIIFVIPGP